MLCVVNTDLHCRGNLYYRSVARDDKSSSPDINQISHGQVCAVWHRTTNTSCWIDVGALWEGALPWWKIIDDGYSALFSLELPTWSFVSKPEKKTQSSYLELYTVESVKQLIYRILFVFVFNVNLLHLTCLCSVVK